MNITTAKKKNSTVQQGLVGNIYTGMCGRLDKGLSASTVFRLTRRASLQAEGTQFSGFLLS